MDCYHEISGLAREATQAIVVNGINPVQRRSGAFFPFVGTKSAFFWFFKMFCKDHFL